MRTFSVPEGKSPQLIILIKEKAPDGNIFHMCEVSRDIKTSNKQEKYDSDAVISKTTSNN